MEKHAYLIVACDHFNQLRTLLRCLDDERNDIFVHIDKKSVFNERDFEDAVKYSDLKFVHRIDVKWGHYSVLECELLLIDAALSKDKYDFLHLLSGVDLPLASQDTLHSFFSSHQNEDFLSLREIETDETQFWNRVRHYYPFSFMFQKSKFAVGVTKVSDALQSVLGIDRNRNCHEHYGLGCNWFSITGNFAEYVHTQKKWIEEIFKDGFCVDELAFQTTWLKWDNPNKKRYCAEKSEYFAKDLMEVVRAIDWHRGLPYTWQMEDLELLKNCGCMFARKFDENVDAEIIDSIVKWVTTPGGILL